MSHVHLPVTGLAAGHFNHLAKVKHAKATQTLDVYQTTATTATITFVDANYTRISGCGNCAALEPKSQNKTKDECPDVCPHRRKLCYLPRTPCQASLGCPSHPNATCVDDYCNGCNHYYVNENGTRISGCGSCADLED